MRTSDTSDERREVAERLREKHRERMEPGQFMPQDLGLQALDYLEDLESCLPEGDSAFTVIADLIDPTCTMRRVHVGGCICSNCHAHLEHEHGENLRYCPRCGVRVVSVDE